MTAPPKLHPAAVKAAEKWVDQYLVPKLEMSFDDNEIRRGTMLNTIAKLIHAAIYDHLKGEGWLELREAAEELEAILDDKCGPRPTWIDEQERLFKALRGVKP